MSQEIPSPALQDTEPGEERTAGPLADAEYVASNMGIVRADKNISVDKIRRNELIFYRIVGEMAVESQIARAVTLHKLSVCLQMDSSNVDAEISCSLSAGGTKESCKGQRKFRHLSRLCRE